MVIIIPNKTKMTPTTLPKICSFTRLAKRAPVIPLTTELKPIISAGINLTLLCKAYPIVPEQAVIVIKKAEVPMAKCNGKFSTKIKIINIIPPPPAPKIPVMIPTNKPNPSEANIFCLEVCNLKIPLVCSAIA